MYALGLDGVVLHECILAFGAFFRVGDVFQIGELGCDVRQHKELRVGDATCQFVDALVGEFDRAVFLIDDKVERIGDDGHFAGVILQVVSLGLQEDVFHTFGGEEFDKCTVLGQALECTEQQQCPFFAGILVFRYEFCLGFGKYLRNKTLLRLHYILDVLLKFIEVLVIAFGHRAGDNQRCAGIVDEHAVDLIDYSVVVFTLYHVLGIHGHVVAQVVKSRIRCWYRK